MALPSEDPSPGTNSAAESPRSLARRLEGLNLYLVGMMGAGKSAVGRPLAEALGYRFVDADALLERVAGRPIPAIFARDGEAGFPDLETAVLDRIAGSHFLVVATGGGAVTGPLGIDPRPARRLDLAGFSHVARVMNVIQACEHTLPIARWCQGDLTVHRIEKRHHLRNRFDDMTVAVKDHNAFRHPNPPKNFESASNSGLSQLLVMIKGADPNH